MLGATCLHLCQLLAVAPFGAPPTPETLAAHHPAASKQAEATACRPRTCLTTPHWPAFSHLFVSCRSFPASDKFLIAPTLRLLSTLYASWSSTRHFFYRQGLLRSLGLPCPVISIGGWAAGHMLGGWVELEGGLAGMLRMHCGAQGRGCVGMEADSAECEHAWHERS